MCLPLQESLSLSNVLGGVVLDFSRSVSLGYALHSSAPISPGHAATERSLHPRTSSESKREREREKERERQREREREREREIREKIK